MEVEAEYYEWHSLNDDSSVFLLSELSEYLRNSSFYDVLEITVRDECGKTLYGTFDITGTPRVMHCWYVGLP